MTTLPELTEAAREHLAGRPVVLRGSPRHGCCGGHALLPVAGVGPPRETDEYQRLTVGEDTWYVEPALLPVAASWTIDVVGFGRWRRLQLLGAEPLDPAASAR